jgi:hypothetical protein
LDISCYLTNSARLLPDHAWSEITGKHGKKKAPFWAKWLFSSYSLCFYALKLKKKIPAVLSSNIWEVDRKSHFFCKSLVCFMI